MENIYNLPTYVYLTSILSYNDLDGNLYWKYRADRNKTWNTRFSGRVAGSVNKPNNKKEYYRRVLNVDGKMIKAHHIVWLFNTGFWPQHEIDHIDRNPLNNKFENLTESNRFLQSKNSNIRKDNISGCKGVSFMNREQKWKAEIWVNKKCTYLGMGDLDYCVKLRKDAEEHYEHSRNTL